MVSSHTIFWFGLGFFIGTISYRLWSVPLRLIEEGQQDESIYVIGDKNVSQTFEIEEEKFFADVSSLIDSAAIPAIGQHEHLYSALWLRNKSYYY